MRFGLTQDRLIPVDTLTLVTLGGQDKFDIIPHGTIAPPTIGWHRNHGALWRDDDDLFAQQVPGDLERAFEHHDDLDIRAHEDMQRISIRNRLDDFMMSHGAEPELATALAPELMGYHVQPSTVKQCVMQHSMQYLREALVVWLARGEKINYSSQDSELLTAAGFTPDAASRADNREKYTPAQNQNYVNKRAELAVR